MFMDANKGKQFSKPIDSQDFLEETEAVIAIEVIRDALNKSAKEERDRVEQIHDAMY